MAIDADRAFRLLIETASEQFNCASLIIDDSIIIESDINIDYSNKLRLVARSSGIIINSLLKQFLFNCVRARRICEHGADRIKISREDRKKFLSDTTAIVSVRDINEHGYDLNRNKAESKMHAHFDNLVLLDETSIIILGVDQIMIGPINLFHTFEAIERIRAKIFSHITVS